jgi:hypothetical protein
MLQSQVVSNLSLVNLLAKVNNLRRYHASPLKIQAEIKKGSTAVNQRVHTG